MAHYKGAASEAGRAMQLMKKRELQQQEVEFRKKKIEEDLKINNIENKFASHYDAVEQQLKSSTIGLVTLDEMKAKQEDIVREREKKLAQKKEEKDREKLRAMEAKQAEKYKQKQQIQALSFNVDEDADEDDDSDEAEEEDKKTAQKRWMTEEGDSDVLKKKIRKNPDVDTSFLPDREREEGENSLREELRQNWVTQQVIFLNNITVVLFVGLRIAPLLNINHITGGTQGPGNQHYVQLLGWIGPSAVCHHEEGPFDLPILTEVFGGIAKGVQ